jgi:23S rRNA G2069 N7-methylase RlmK/C1962 C5-methylase RlmI
MPRHISGPESGGAIGGKTEAQAEMLYNRLVKRHRHLKKWARRIDAEAYRLYHRDIPEIPLVIDLYGDAVSGALYKRPYEKDETQESLWLSAMEKAVSQALEIPADRIFLKRRERQRGKAQYTKQGKKGFFRDIREGGLTFRVNLSDYLDTGLFLDARPRRTLLRSQAQGKRILNLFCYTASFSVYAAAGGADQVDSVDMSRAYLEWATINFALNGMEGHLSAGLGRQPGKPRSLIRSDALSFLKQAAAQKTAWDLIILDPPSFSNSKKMTTPLDIRRDHRELINRSLEILKPGAKLWFSANAKGFRLDPRDFSGLHLRDLSQETVDEDFKGKKTPVFYEINKP